MNCFFFNTQIKNNFLKFKGNKLINRFIKQNKKVNNDLIQEDCDATTTLNADRADHQFLPIKVLWSKALEEKKKRIIEGKKVNSYSYAKNTVTDVQNKKWTESYTYLMLLFKKDKWICDAYINSFGRLRIGKLFQDLDGLAGRIAYRHCSPSEPVIVTASVDQICILKRIEKLEEYNFVISGSVAWAGRSSMEIIMNGYVTKNDIPEVINFDTFSEKDIFLTASFTFVARDPLTHKSFEVNKLSVTNEDEKKKFMEADIRVQKKRDIAKTQEIFQPTEQEYEIIHNLWKYSKDMIHGEATDQKIIKMKDSKMYSNLLMQPQYRNRHSYMIFGGYILKESFELAYCTASNFCSSDARFISLDSTNFKCPVLVGSFLFMETTVVYTEPIEIYDCANDQIKVVEFNNKKNSDVKGKTKTQAKFGTLMQIKVVTKTKNLDDDEYKVSGTFIYSFYDSANPKGNKNISFCTVIPQTYNEMMEYIKGRRRVKNTANFLNKLYENKNVFN